MSSLDGLEPSTGEILVIPKLEEWYLRHENGLTVIRKLVERLIAIRKRVLIGCDSWAWVFLQYAIGIEDMVGGPRSLAPFDAKRLDAWFRAAFDLQRYTYRQSGSDEPVFPDGVNRDKRSADEEKTEQPQCEISKAIHSLAAKARGNPGVALALWRESLRSRDTDAKQSAPVAGSYPSVLWAVSPSELARPQLSVDVDRVYRFILHAILLHGGVSRSLLAALLPFSGDEIQRRVSVLRRAGFLEMRDGKLRVRLTAYPLVRRDLQSEGFLTDAF